MKKKQFVFLAATMSAAAFAGLPDASEHFLSAARRAYPTAAYSGYTNTLVNQFGVKKEDNADRPVPGGRIRWHYVEGMRNVRDIGGWNGLPTGRVFRGSEPDCKPNPNPKKHHGLEVTENGLRTIRDVLKIKTDLDLRGKKECPHSETSALGVKLVRVPIGAYTNAFAGVKGYAEALRVFADPENYPIYFHCWGGADRTGTLAFLLEGLCGASETDLSIDYELTSFAGIFGVRLRTGRPYQPFPQFVARLKAYPGDTLSEKIAAYMETTLGLSKDEIAAIKRNILGDRPADQTCALTTMKLQKRLDSVAAGGGGTLVVESGTHRIGTLFLRSNVELRLAKGCVLEGSTNLADYTGIAIKYSEMPRPWHAIVAAVGVTNVAITGEGEIFGNGSLFPISAPTNRPRGIIFMECGNVRLKGISLRDFASWGVYFKECDGVEVTDVTIDSHANSNNDGLDIEARNVVVSRCLVDSGDDAICIKSDNPSFVVENVEVRDCVARSACSALKIGTATHGTCRNIRFLRCIVDSCRRGFVNPATGIDHDIARRKREFPGCEPIHCPIAAMAVDNVDGGVVEDILYDDIDVRAAMVPLFVRGGARRARSFAGLATGIPFSGKCVFRRIAVRNVRAIAKSPTASSITGVAECRPAEILLENVDFLCRSAGGESAAARTLEVPEVPSRYPDPYMFDYGILPAWGLYVRHADKVRLRNVNMRLDGGFDARDRIVAVDASVQNAE